MTRESARDRRELVSMTAGDPPVHPPADDEEARFLAAYDLAAFPRPSVTVDVALLTIVDGSFHAALVRRDEQPAMGRWALPGGFVRLDESLEDAVARVLRDKTGLHDVYTAQLATFGAVDRDPRGRIITVTYFALVPADRLAAELAAGARATLARLEVDEEGGNPGPVRAVGSAGTIPLAFDHAAILGQAIGRLRGRLWYAPDAFALVPDEFTLLDLQETYEAILGGRVDKNSFRRRILASGLVFPVGRRRVGLRSRPAELFRFRPADAT